MLRCNKETDFLAESEKIGSKKALLKKNYQLQNFIITLFLKYLILLDFLVI